MIMRGIEAECPLTESQHTRTEERHEVEMNDIELPRREDAIEVTRLQTRLTGEIADQRGNKTQRTLECLHRDVWVVGEVASRPIGGAQSIGVDTVDHGDPVSTSREGVAESIQVHRLTPEVVRRIERADETEVEGTRHGGTNEAKRSPSCKRTAP
jgi:hypothetical protein